MTAENPENPIGQLEHLTSEMVQLTSTDLTVPGDLTAPEYKQLLAAKRSELFAKQREMEIAAENARKQMEAAQRAAEAAMAPLKKELQRMAEGIWTVGLYLGVDEEIVPLRGGKPAPIGTPITVRQQVLAMDEECIIAAEDGGIDVRDIESFDEWILASPSHLQQVLPEEKGVVAILPSRQQRSYGDPWMSAALNEANKQTWFLIRNGEKLYRLLAKDFNVGPRLIPTKDEFTAYFRKDRWGNAIQPGTSAWAAAEEAAGAKQRHYMRVALILQGVIERTNAFDPIPEGLSLLTLEAYDSGQIVTVSDDEKVLTSSRKPFFEWLKERNALLRPGMRIVGAFNSESFRYANEREGYHRHSRLYPETAELPPSNTVLYVEQNSRKEMVCRYERASESIWDASSYTYRPAQQRASVTLFPMDKFIIPIDLVTVAEMEEYISARSERANYLTLVPLLRAAIAAKRAEHAEEAPFRRLIVDTLSLSHDLDVTEAERAAEELVEWWKFANRHHRPLVNDDPELVAKAMRMITAEYERRSKAKSDAKGNEGTVARIRALKPDVMAVVRKRDGSVLALEPNVSEYGFVTKKTFFRQYRYINDELRLQKDWSVIPPHSLAKMQEIWSNAAWQEWDKAAAVTGLLTDPEVKEMISAVSEKEGLVAVVHEMSRLHSSNKTKGFDAFCYRGETGTASSWGSDRDQGVVLEHSWVTFSRKSGKLVISVKEMRPVVWTSNEAPWVESRSEVVFQDEAIMAQAEADLKPLRQAAELERNISSRSYRILRSIQSQWRQLTEEKTRLEHIDEYGSDDLWKQWLRTHPLPELHVTEKEIKVAFDEYIRTHPVPTGDTLVVTDYYSGKHAKDLLGITVIDS